MALSKIDTAAIAADAIEAAQLKSDAITSGDLPAGSVLQVLNAQNSTTVSLPNNETFSTGVSLAITPSSTSSKILCIGMGAGDIASGYFRALFFRLTRGGSQIFYNQYLMYDSNNQDHNIATQPMVFLDSPATTSAVTYAIQARHQSGSAFTGTFNGAINQYNISTLTLMEIAV